MYCSRPRSSTDSQSIIISLTSWFFSSREFGIVCMINHTVNTFIGIKVYTVVDQEVVLTLKVLISYDILAF